MSLTIERIDHVVLNCRDLQTTVEWYERVLGMRRETFGDNRLALKFGNQKINVRPSGAPNWVTGAFDTQDRWTCASSPRPVRTISAHTYVSAAWRSSTDPSRRSVRSAR